MHKEGKGEQCAKLNDECHGGRSIAGLREGNVGWGRDKIQMVNDWLSHGSSIAASQEEYVGPTVSVQDEGDSSPNIEQTLTGKREETCEGREGGGDQSSSEMYLCIEDEPFGIQVDLENEFVGERGEDEVTGVDEGVQVDSSLPHTVN